LKFLRFWFPVFCYSGIIFTASTIPNLKTPLPDTGFDKFVHVLEFMPFGFLLARALIQGEDKFNDKKIWILVSIASLLYGISDEWHQSFVIGRSCTMGDVIADTVGGILGIGLYRKIGKKNDTHKAV